ncbi:MAG TPA: HAD family hydrolase, partial [Pseudomonadales bacterium]|nr:HAD family hydrolase [Pseudomonadales bacterium]
ARNIAWGIVTNKPSQYTDAIIQQLNLQHRCRVAICPDQVQNKKPHPEPILKACKEIGVDPLNTFYVGDHIRDIESGRAAGAQTIAALWGYIPKDEDTKAWGADYYVTHPEQLTNFFSRYW